MAEATGVWERRGSQIILIDPTFADEGAPEAEASPGTSDFVRWIQQSLSLILGRKLTLDGIAGPQTRTAIRDFQRSRSLVPDGVVGPITERAVRGALAAVGGPTPRRPAGPAGPVTPLCAGIGQPSEDLEGFLFNDHRVMPFHQPQIIKLARCIVASQSTPAPIRSVGVVGHTDPVGTDEYNVALGLRRAQEVARQLRDAVDRIKPSTSRQVAFNVESRGETAPVPGSAERSRRVQVFLALPGGGGVPPPPRPKRIKLEDVIKRSNHVLDTQPFPAEQGKRLRCVLAKIQAPGAHDNYINGKDILVRKLAGGAFERLPVPVFARVVIKDRVRSDLLNPLFASPAEDDAFVAKNLSDLDERILAGIVLIEKQSQRNSELNVANPVLQQMQEFVAVEQRTPQSVYSCYR